MRSRITSHEWKHWYVGHIPSGDTYHPANLLHDIGLPAKSLILEITEDAIVNDMERVSKVLQEIKNWISIALDDFGTGYSSLTLLRELPIDILKIDKSFVRTLDRNINHLKIVQAIIGLGKNLGLTIIAEGVETEQQTRLLLRHECYYQQGYYFSRPIPYQALFELMHEKKIHWHTGTYTKTVCRMRLLNLRIT